MTHDEKIRLCVGSTFWRTAPVERLGIPSLYLNDGPHGVRATTSDAIIVTDNKRSTCFPTPSALAASWDPDLMTEVARAIGHEARAHGVHVLLGPGINLQRSPLGGRNFEYFSEDPYLTSVAGIAYVRGIQSTGTSACLKHFVGNDQELDRMTTDVVIDQRAFHEVYLQPFAACIAEAEPAMVMASYNKVNGEQVAESGALLGDLLRDRLGFDGVIVSDWGAVESVAAAHRAGLDLEMPPEGDRQRDELSTLTSREPDAVEHLEARVRRLVRLASHHDSRMAVDIPFDRHYDIARRAAAESIVLLANNGVLPLRPDVHRIALVGELAAAPRIQGRGSSLVEPERVSTPIASFKRLRPDLAVDHAPGTDPTGADHPAARADARRMATTADLTIAIVGLPDLAETEGADRTTLDLPEPTQSLLDELGQLDGPVVVVTMCGSPVRLPRPERFDAVVHAGLVGAGVGDALVDIVTGVSAPGGRLAQTWPTAEHDMPPSARAKTTATAIWYGEGVHVGHRHYDVTDRPVVFPFGHGLTYTSFDYSDLSVTVSADGDEFDVEVSFVVRNTGDREGKEVPQVYVESPFDLEGVRRLRAHRVVRLGPADSTTVDVRLTKHDFQYFDDRAGEFLTAAGEHQLVVGASSRDFRLSARIDVPLLQRERNLLAGQLTGDSTGREFLRIPESRAAFEHSFADLAGSEIHDIILDIPLSLAARLFPSLIDRARIRTLLDRVEGSTQQR